MKRSIIKTSLLMALIALLAPWSARAQFTQAGFTYTLESGIGAFNSIRTTGTTLVANTTADDNSYTVALPFDMAWGSNTIAAGSNVRISANGWVELKTSAVGNSCASSFTSTGTNFVCAVMTQDGFLGPTASDGAFIAYKRMTDASGNDTSFMIEWHGETFYNSSYRTNSYSSYQVELFPNGDVTIRFDTCSMSYTSSTYYCGVHSGMDNQTVSVAGSWRNPTLGTTLTPTNLGASNMPEHGRYYKFKAAQSACPNPGHISVNATAYSAQMQWQGQTGQRYLITIDTIAFSSSHTPTNVYNTTSTSYTFNNLRPGKRYYGMICGICTTGDTSFASSFSFSTQYDASILPLQYGFEDATASGTTGQISLTKGTNSGTAYPYPNSTYAHDKNYCLYMYGNSSYYSYVAMPMFEGIGVDSLTVRFHTFATNLTYRIEVGVMSNPNDYSTFRTVATIAPDYTYNWKESIVSLKNYTGPNGCIAFRTPQGLTSTVYLDDITIYRTGSEPTFKDVKVESTTTGAMVKYSQWPSFDTATYLYSATVIDTATGSNTQFYPTEYEAANRSFMITGLQPSTGYLLVLEATSLSNIVTDSVYFKTQCPHTTLDRTTALNSSGTTNAHLPIRNTKYSYTQQLQLATEVGASRTLTSLAYYQSYTTAQHLFTNCTVYLAQTPNATLTAFIPYANLTKVYEGPVNTEGMGWKEIVFDTPFNYDSTAGNLVVAILNNSGIYWTTMTQRVISGATRSRYYTSSTQPINIQTLTASGTVFAYYNEMRFTSCDANVCTAPVIALSDYDTMNISINIAAGNDEQQWVVAYSSNNGVSWVDAGLASNTTFTLQNLTPATLYSVRAGTVCNTDTMWSDVLNVRTLCAPIRDYYTYGFEDATAASSSGQINPCWTKGTNSTTAWPYPSTGQHKSGNYSLYGYATTTYYCYIASPMLADSINNFMIKFNALKTSTSTTYGVVTVGTMSDPTDYNTFTPMRRYSVSAVNTWTEFIHAFNGINSGDRYIALALENIGTNYTYLDDITIMRIPQCPTVNNLSAEANSFAANFTWNSDPSIETPSSATLTVIDTATHAQQVFHLSEYAINNHQFFATGLNQGSGYMAILTMECSNGVDGMSDTTYFTTDCPRADYAEVGVHDINFSAIPISPNNIYCYTQSLYTRAELPGAMQIGRIAYNHPYANAPVTTVNNVSIYMGHYSRDKFIVDTNITHNDDGDEIHTRVRFVDRDSLKLVYTGPMYFGNAAGWTSFTLDSTFNYDGTHSLVIAVKQASSSAGTATYFAGTYDTARVIWITGNNSDTISGVTDQSYWIKPDIHFYGACGTGACVAPNFGVNEVDSNSITMGIAPGLNENSWIVQYRSTNDTDWIDAGVASYTDFSITGLDASNAYVVRVGTECTTDTLWANETIVWTTCEPANLPLRENCNSYPNTNPCAHLFPCWTLGGTNDPHFVQNIVDVGPTLCTRRGNWVALPRVADSVHLLELSFTYGAATAEDLYIGVMSNPNDITTFHPIDTVNNQMAGGFFPFIVDLSSAPHDAGQYVAFYAANQQTYLDDIDLHYIPACVRADSITAVSTTSSSITLDWNTGNSFSSSWIVEYGELGFVNGTGTVATVTTLPHTFTNLNHSTNYDFRIRTVCASLSDTSVVNNIIVATACDAIATIPFTENFENANAPAIRNAGMLPLCWKYDMIGSNAVPDSLKPQIMFDHTNFPGGGHGVSMKNFAVLAMPEVGVAMDSIQLNYSLHVDNLNDGIVIGVVDSVNPGFAASFVPIDTVYNVSLNPENHYVYMAKYRGQGRYIAFRNISAVGAAQTIDYLDNVSLTYAPGCLPVTNITLSTLDHNSATIHWTPLRLTSTSFQVDYGTVGHAAGTGTIVNVNNADSLYLQNLQSSTMYDIYIRTSCGTNSYSEWSSLFRITTECAPYTTFPYTEDFETITAGVGVMPDCWKVITMDYPTTTTSYRPYVYSNSTYAAAGNNSLYMNYRSLVSLPTMGGTFNNLVVDFDLYTLNANYGLVIGIMNNAGRGAENTFVPLDTVYNTAASTHEHHQIVLGSYGYTGNGRVIGFRNIDRTNASTASAGMAIDNVAINSYDCMIPYNVRCTLTTDNSANIAWNALGTPAGFEVEYGPHGFTQGNGTTVTTTTAGTTINGLASLTRYDYYVRTNCSSSSSSPWVGPFEFSTDVCLDGSMAIVGNPTSTTTSLYMPAYSYYANTYSQTIIDSAQLATLEGSIQAIAYNISNATGNSAFNDVKIYLGHTSKTDFTSTTDWVVIDSSNRNQFVQVYRGTMYHTTGWNTYILDSTFTWNGHDNIVVAVQRSGNSTASSTYFYTTGTSLYKSIYYYNASTDANIANPPTASNRLASQPTMRLLSCEQLCNTPRFGQIATTYETATVNWTGRGNNYQLQVRPNADADYSTDTLTVAGTTVTLDSLVPSTTYRVRVRQVCDNIGSASDWAETVFTTDNLNCAAPSNVEQTSTFNSVTLDWQVSSTTQHAWNVRLWNSTTDTVYRADSHPFTIAGLTPGVSYNVAVSGLCGSMAAVESDTAENITFTTTVCDTISNLQSSIEGRTATITWSAGSNNSGYWAVEYGLAGFTSGEGTRISVTQTSAILTDLEPETNYDVYVIAYCAEGVTSIASSPLRINVGSVAIATAEDDAQVTIYPNPATERTTIDIKGIEGRVNVALIDLNGRVVLNTNVDCNNDCNKTIELNTLPQGSYFVRIQGENVNIVRKLVVR